MNQDDPNQPYRARSVAAKHELRARIPDLEALRAGDARA